MAAPLPAHLLHLGLQRSPFPSTPDAVHYFDGNGLRVRLTEIEHCILARKGFVLITGEVGLGKSTLLRRLVSRLSDQNCKVALVMHTHLRGEELLRAILRDLGLSPGASFDDDLATFNTYLIERHHAGETVAIIIDDAQNLCPESLELIRLLSNLETSQFKLVQIVLCGQPELVDTLAQPRVRQLASRISRHVELLPLSLTEAERYVRFRLEAAGAGHIRVGRGALQLLHRDSAGNPRRLHLLLDGCLYGLVASRSHLIDTRLARLAMAEAGIRPSRARRVGLRPFALAAGAGAFLLLLALLFVPPFRQPALAGIQPLPVSPPAVLTRMAPVAPRPSLAPAPGAFARCLARLAGIDPIEAMTWAARPIELASRSDRLPASLEAIEVPSGIEIAAGPTTCIAPAGYGQRAVVVWAPHLATLPFALGTRGQPVRALQVRLAEIGLYRAAVDGMVGPRTITALADFQRTRGLPVTGYPDPLTRLLLEHDATRTAVVAREGL